MSNLTASDLTHKEHLEEAEARPARGGMVWPTRRRSKVVKESSIWLPQENEIIKTTTVESHTFLMAIPW
jgi:hypothetical protein